MNANYPIAAVAELIGEPARAAILIMLADGRALPAGELARAAGVSAPSASAHLSKLVGGGLLSVQGEGRHRYYTMASPDEGQPHQRRGASAPKPQVPGVTPPPET